MYRDDLARIHDEGFGDYAEAMAPGILEILGVETEVLEVGCGSGALTEHLVQRGHVVIATDSSESMLKLVENKFPEVRVEAFTLGKDPVPRAVSIVSIGHVINYLPSAVEIGDAVVELARAKDSGGVLVFDVCDLSYGNARPGVTHSSVDGDGWSIDVTTIFEPPDRFIRGMTTRLSADDGTFRDDHETHINVLVSVDELVDVLTADGFSVSTSRSAGDFELPDGMFLLVVTGQSNS